MRKENGKEGDDIDDMLRYLIPSEPSGGLAESQPCAAPDLQGGWERG